MLKLGFLFLALAGLVYPGSLPISVHVTQTQAVACYPVTGDGPYTLALAGSGDVPNPPDVDGVLFPGANLDLNRPTTIVNGARRCVTLGTRTAAQASDGLFYSRPLQPETSYQLTISGNGNAGTVSFVTARYTFGRTYPEPPPYDANAPRRYGYPTIRPARDRNKWFLDPTTGIPFMPITGPGMEATNLASTVYSGKPGAATVAGGSWTNGANGAVIDTTVAQNATADQSPLFIRAAMWCTQYLTVAAAGSAAACVNGSNAWGNPYDSYPVSIDDIQIQLAMSGSGATTAAQFALSVDGVNPATDWQTQSLSGSLVTTTFPASTKFPASMKGTGNNQTIFGYWFANPAKNQLTRPDISPHTGTVVNTGGVLTWASGEKFRVGALTTGSRIDLGGTLYTITAVTSPISLTIASPPANGTYNYRVFNFGVLVRKAAATTGNLNVDGATFTDYESGQGLMPRNGALEMCSTSTVVASDGVVVRPCLFQLSSDHQLVAIEEATGKLRFISNADVRRCDSSDCYPGVNNASNNYGAAQQQFWKSFNATDPSKFYGFTDSFGKFTLIEQQYLATAGRGACPKGWLEITAANCPTYPANDNYKQINKTPTVAGAGADKSILAQMTAFNSAHRALNSSIPIFDAAKFALKTFDPVDPITGWVNVWAGGQDTFGWMATLDPSTTPATVNTMLNSYYQPPCFFCLNHGSSTFAGWSDMSTNNPWYQVNGDGLHGRWILNVTNSIDNVTQNTCVGITDPLYTQFNGQARCIDLTVSGPDLCHDTPSGSETAPMYGTCSWNGAYTHLAGVNVTVGMMLDDGANAGSVGSSEMFRVVKVNGNTVTVLRAYGTPAVQQGTYARVSSLAAHTGPWVLRALCSTGDGNGTGGQWWANLNSDPTGWTTGVVDWPTIITGHADFWTSGIWVQPPHFRTSGNNVSTMIGSKNTFNVSLDGPFNGLSPFATTSNWVQTHPGVSRDAANPRYAVDSNPLSNVSNASNVLWPQTASNVNGDVWRIAAADVRSGGNWPASMKTLPLVATVGGFLLAPASDVNAAYTFCVAYASGECLAGSAAGDVYLNAPQIAHDGYCGPWDYSRNICVFQPSSIVSKLNLYWFPLDSASNGSLALPLVGMNRYNQQSVFSSAHASFSGRWLYGHLDYYGGGMRSDLIAVRMPQVGYQSTARSNGFVDHTVNLAAAPGASKVRARFGYGEYGAPGQFYCAYNRHEECRTSPSPTVLSPFYFASDASQSWQDCASGCTVRIPSIPGRIVYYAIDRLDSSGNVLSTIPMEAAAVP